MATIEVKVPDIGDFKDVPVIELLVKPGDKVTAEQSLITLESDKATLDVPSPAAGTVKELKVKLGDTVSKDSLIVLLDTGAAAEKPTTTPAPAAAPAKEVAAAPVAAPAVEKPGAAPNPAPAKSTIEVKVPDIGDFKDVPIIELLVKPGDQVTAEQSLITLESDKATLDVPSPAAGTIKALKVKLGDTVSKGSLIVLLETGDGSGARSEEPKGSDESGVMSQEQAKPAVPPPSSPLPPGSPLHMPTPAETAAELVGGHKAHASPSVRQFARELGVDIGVVAASGIKGRITFDDVKRYVKGVISSSTGSTTAAGGGLNLLSWPKIDFSKFGPVEVQPLSRIKKISGANLARNWAMIPHVTQFEQADITVLEAYRVAANQAAVANGTKLTMLAFLIKASVLLLKKFPAFNSSLDGETLVMKGYFNIGFAADTPNGLVVPVIRDADKKTVPDIARETAELAKKARDGKISATEMQGGCFTISSLGGIGGTAFTPIINAPEVAILGVSKSQMQPVWDGVAFTPRLMMPLSLSYDHRVVDGAAGARFTNALVTLLADPKNFSV
jgi:pyruvate dehydrogenase E2 component (dihydrolipoamide acetyltransferase)